MATDFPSININDLNPSSGGFAPVDMSNVSTGLAPVNVADMEIDQEDSAFFPTQKPTTGKLFGAGKDIGDSLFYHGLSAGMEAFSFDEEAAKYKAKAQFQERLASRVQPETLMDKVIVGAGTAAPAIAATAAGALAAPLVGASAATGATLAGTLAGLGLTQGDLQGKALDLDENHKADLTQLALGAALTAPDLLLVGRAKAILSPIMDAAGSKIAQNTANSIIGGATRIAANATSVGAMEAVQDVGTSLGANLLTDTPIDQSRIDAILAGAEEEFLVGAILGVPISGIETTARMLKESQVAVDEEGKPKVSVRVDENGKQTLEQLVPVEDAAKQPSMFSMAVAPIFGNLTAGIRNKLWDNKAVQELSSYFNQAEGSRFTAKHNTIHTDSKLKEGEFAGKLGDVYNAKDADVQEAFNIIATGNVEAINANPIAVKVRETLHGDVIATYEKNGWEVTEAMRKPDYLPLVSSIDWDKIAKNQDSVIADIKQQGVKQGLEKGKIDSLVLELTGLVNNYRREGSVHSYAANSTTNRARRKISEALEEGKSVKGVVKGLVRESKGRKKKSPLDVERALGELNQEFWEKSYVRKGMTPKKRLRLHTKLISESIAHKEAFGENFEKFYELVGKAVAENKNTKSELTSAEVDKMFDILSTSQRILLKPINPKLRAIQNKVRGFENITLLGLSVLPSIAEILVIPLNTGLKPTLTALGKAVKHGSQELARSLGANIPRNDLDQAMSDLSISLPDSLSVVSNRIGEDSQMLSNLEERVIQLSGLPLFTTFTRSWAAFAAEAHIKQMLGDLSTGKLSKSGTSKAIRKLNEAGVDVAQGVQWLENGAPRKGEYYGSIKASILELVNDTIIDPDPADKSTWFNDERFKLITQLKSFSTVFTNRVMVEWGRKMSTGGPIDRLQQSTEVAAFVASYLALQVGVAALREYIKNGEIDRWEDKEVYQHVSDSVAYLGLIGLGVDTIRAREYGGDPLVAILGPAANDASRLLKVLPVLATDPEKGMETLIKRVIPNMPFKGQITESVEDLINEAFK
jgi:hypothetical protein